MQLTVRLLRCPKLMSGELWLRFQPVRLPTVGSTLSSRPSDSFDVDVRGLWGRKKPRPRLLALALAWGRAGPAVCCAIRPLGSIIIQGTPDLWTSLPVRLQQRTCSAPIGEL